MSRGRPLRCLEDRFALRPPLPSGFALLQSGCLCADAFHHCRCLASGSLDGFLCIRKRKRRTHVLRAAEIFLTDQPLSSASDFSINRLQSRQQGSVRGVAAGSRRNELYLKLLIVSLFLPEGLSAFIGDYRLSPARIVLIPLSLVAAVHMLRRLNTLSFVLVPSDIIALLAGIWMVLASVVASGFADGLKSGGALALEFTGAYYVFRSF